MAARRRPRGVLLAAVAILLAAPGAASAATPISIWRMDEQSGSTMVDTVNGVNGTLKDVGLGAGGVFSPAYLFNGSSSIATVPHNGFHNVPANTTFTVSAWVRFPARPSASIVDFDLVRKGLSSTSGGHWKMEIFTNGKGYCQFRGSSGSRTINTGPDLADDRWHLIKCVKRTSSLTLEVDGVAYTSNGTIGSVINTARLTIGAKSTGGDWYKGIMEHVSVVIGD